ncbi:TauD/TfdA family dioxygenase [Streptomyces sp. NPDC093228]|uniref:2-trimethylaminoethylphosphonate dioxygenase n=1 Tax=unclassified Streptomyces TaxID=2593676 RepID=UPI0007412D3F|nr:MULTISPECIES: TauD/TfdA family dioxygenase [unclassified Streptomyces]KUJ41138.1 gamma-butyrobetaine dioxygenase [Streptomyces sp. NRRL F-5122]MDX3260969.1 TauD/TfdA family dioxygenase [Streptomyces sp. MI02-2A]
MSALPTFPIGDLPAMWLRDNCPCAECRDPRSGQKLFQITALPTGLRVGRAGTAAGTPDPAVEVVWQPDGHRSVYPVAWLAANRPGRTDHGDLRTEHGKELWTARDIAGRLPAADWADYLDKPGVRARMLESVLRLGFMLLREVPQREEQVLEVAETFGYVRETNYGKLFDVRVEPDPNNLAFTSVAITPHTDNPYRDPVPTLQLLHCLVNDADGGDSGLVDGFAAAAMLRREDPEAFEVLTRTPVPFVFRDAGTELRADRPLIGTDSLGRVREVRFNNRSISTLRLPAEELEHFYAAYRTFAELLLRPELQLDLRLTPGDCLVFDNTRLLHARTAFAQDGARHLQGCYADLDGLAGALAVLRRADTLEPVVEMFAGAGTAEYLGEPVTMAQHMLQAGARAEAAGAPPHLVAAALLHDLGHVDGEVVTGLELMAGTDNRHSHTGADLLGRWFGPEVTEPVRLHVAAKRYLCAVEPDYYDQLSEASKYTLKVQGGVMTPEQAAEFAALPGAADAVAVRRWDEQAKDPNADTPPFAHFLPLLAALVRG